MELSGGRELVNEKRAEELISAITVSNPTHIRLSNKSFDNAAATKIAQYLESLEGVTVADVSDIIAGRPEDEALRTLNIICSSLKKFDLLEVNLSDNALGAKGVEECKAVLLGDNIQRLYVCNNGLSAEAAELLAKILIREAGVVEGSDSKKTPPLELLHFYNNMAGDGGARAIANIVVACPQLVDFRFSATRSTAAGCESIAAAIATLPNLRRLDVSDNNFKGKAGEVLVQALKNKTQLEYLNLRDDALEGVSASPEKLSLFNALVEAATAGSSLKHVDLSGNNFDAEAAQQLSRALQHLPQLTALYLDDCEIGTEGARHIASAVKKLTNLRTLSLCTCEITAAGAYVLARAVAELPQFVNLELNGNQISEAGVEAIKGVLQQAGKVVGDLEDNDEDGDDDLEEALAEFEADDAEAEDKEEELLVEAFQAQCLSSRSQDATSPSVSTPASPSAAALRKAAEVALTVEEVVEETVQTNLEDAAAAVGVETSEA